MFGKLFRRNSSGESITLVAHLAARLQPFQRGEFFEDPLDEDLKARGIGKVVGGGSEMADDPIGISSCDIEISACDTTKRTISDIIGVLERLGAPKGSELRVPTRTPITFGAFEGLHGFGHRAAS